MGESFAGKGVFVAAVGVLAAATLIGLALLWPTGSEKVEIGVGPPGKT